MGEEWINSHNSVELTKNESILAFEAIQNNFCPMGDHLRACMILRLLRYIRCSVSDHVRCWLFCLGWTTVMLSRWFTSRHILPLTQAYVTWSCAAKGRYKKLVGVFILKILAQNSTDIPTFLKYGILVPLPIKHMSQKSILQGIKLKEVNMLMRARAK